MTSRDRGYASSMSESESVRSITIFEVDVISALGLISFSLRSFACDRRGGDNSKMSADLTEAIGCFGGGGSTGKRLKKSTARG